MTTPPDAEAVAREAIADTLTEAPSNLAKAYAESLLDDYREAVERRVRAQIAAEVESAEYVERLAGVVDDMNPRITHQGDREDAAVYCRYIAKRIRAAQDATGGGDG